MSKSKLVTVLSLIILILVLAACGREPQAVQLARTLLAVQLDVDEDAIETVSAEEVEWTDSCLGWGGPAESCAAVITPGWQIFFAVNGVQHEVRTNQDGTIIRTAQP